MQTPKKLHSALNTLGILCEADLPKSRIVRLVEQGEVSEQQVYETLERRGYTWQKEKWQLFLPSWLQDATKDFESALEGGRPTPRSKYAPIEELPLILFRAYLASMEAFIEAEIQSCHKNYETRVEMLKDDEDKRYLEWQITSHDLETLERFVYILRVSFFVNLYSYQYHRQELAKRERLTTMRF